MAYKTRTFEGLQVVDATDSIILNILPQDVKGANKKNPAKCAAARAGQRELKTDVRVFLARTYVKYKKNWVRFATPESISREIISFDRGSNFEVGKYKLIPVAPAQRLGISRGPMTKKTGRNKGGPYHTTGMIRERGKYDNIKRK